jgi:hypothetical protein
VIWLEDLLQVVCLYLMARLGNAHRWLVAKGDAANNEFWRFVILLPATPVFRCHCFLFETVCALQGRHLVRIMQKAVQAARKRAVENGA